MKANWPISLFVGFHFLPLLCQSQQWDKKIEKFSTQLTVNPTRAVYDSLHFLVADHYVQLTAEERRKIRNILKKQARRAVEKLCSSQEKGIKITIKGRLTDEHKKAIPHAQLYIFQADNKGYYAPTDSALKRMNEADPRLFGFVTTDKSGHYSFETIQPAHYPNPYNGRFIPQHIHITATVKGYKPLNLQMAFDNDPSLKDPYWQEWAKKQNFPVVTLHYDKNNRLYGVCDLVLNPL
ncbi:MAG: hypothetical protein U0X91_21815 [Spirosomataceae bacterium]